MLSAKQEGNKCRNDVMKFVCLATERLMNLNGSSK